MPEKTLKIYRENGDGEISGDYVIERINQFNHSFKRKYITEEGLKEGLHSYKYVLDEYDIDVSDELWGTVLQYLNQLVRREQ